VLLARLDTPTAEPAVAALKETASAAGAAWTECAERVPASNVADRVTPRAGLHPDRDREVVGGHGSLKHHRGRSPRSDELLGGAVQAGSDQLSDNCG